MDVSGARAATGIIKRSVAPDSPQSMGFLGVLGSMAPSIAQQFSCSFIFAPNASIACKVASVSFETKGLKIFVTPSDSNAAINIRCVYALEAGAHTSPLSL
jgi:hypothetical protein